MVSTEQNSLSAYSVRISACWAHKISNDLTHEVARADWRYRECELDVLANVGQYRELVAPVIEFAVGRSHDHLSSARPPY